MKELEVKMPYYTVKNARFEISSYVNNGSLAIYLYGDCGEGYEESVCDITVNLNLNLPEDCAAIHSYGENKGLLEILQQADFIHEVLYWARSGFVEIPVCRFNMEKIKEYAVEDEENNEADQ